MAVWLPPPGIRHHSLLSPVLRTAAKEVADAALAQAGQNATDIAAIAGDYVKASDLVNDVYIFQCGTSDTNFHVVPAKN